MFRVFGGLGFRDNGKSNGKGNEESSGSLRVKDFHESWKM